MDSYIIKHAFRHFLPAAILTGIILQVRIITDCIIVGHLIGPDAVSAINLYIPLEEIVYSLICVVVLGASFLGAECVGRQDYREASHYYTVSLVSTGALVTVLVAGIALFFQPVISLLAGSGDSVIRSSTATYTLWMLPTFLVMAPNSVLRYFVNIDGKPRLVTLSILVSFLLNPILDYVLIRFAGMGMAGAALATLVSDLAGMGVLAVFFMARRSLFRLRMPKDWARVLRSSAQMGVPLSASLFLMAIVVGALNRIVLHFQGASGLYVWAVAQQIVALCEMFLEGISDMNQSIGGTLLGSGDFKSFNAYVRRTLRFVQLTILAVTVCLLLFPGVALSLFGEGEDGGGMAGSCRILRIMSLFLFPYMQLLFYENVHSLVRRERLSLAFQVLYAAGLLLLPLAAGLFWPALFWWSFPLLAALLCAAQLVTARRIQHREGNVRAPFLAEAFPIDVEADFTVEYNRESMTAVLEQIRTVADICELPGGKGTTLTVCCEEVMNKLLARKVSDGSMQGNFEIRIVDKPELTQVSFKAGGTPFNPVVSECDRVTHQYLYGVNVTVLEFYKDSGSSPE